MPGIRTCGAVQGTHPASTPEPDVQLPCIWPSSPIVYVAPFATTKGIDFINATLGPTQEPSIAKPSIDSRVDSKLSRENSQVPHLAGLR